MLNGVKSRFHSGKIILIGLIIIVLFSCGSEPEKVSVISEIDAPDFFKLADSAAIVLVKSLGGRLTDVIQNDGVIAAIDVCYKEAYEITNDLEDSFDKIISIKRVSNKYRNEKNAPDEYEAQALLWFEEQIEQGNTIPKVYGQKIQRKKSDIYRFYKPLKMQTKCLLCHGDTEMRPPDVSKRINKLYPEDKAVDYYEGDFRGLIRVEMQMQRFVKS